MHRVRVRPILEWNTNSLTCAVAAFPDSEQIHKSIWGRVFRFGKQRLLEYPIFVLFRKLKHFLRRMYVRRTSYYSQGISLELNTHMRVLGRPRVGRSGG